MAPPLLSPLAPQPGRVLAVVAEGAEARRLERSLVQMRDIELVVSRGVINPGLVDGEFDLVALDITAGGGAALMWGLQLLRADVARQIVFFCEHEAAPEVAAVRALGLTPLVVGPRGRDWLVTAGPALVRLARARRAVRAAEGAIPEMPRSPPLFGRSAEHLPLPIAEHRFRETYVRALLALSGDRVRAAKHAGVPYRTLCNILRALEISPSDPDISGGGGRA